MPIAIFMSQIDWRLAEIIGNLHPYHYQLSFHKSLLILNTET